MSCSIPFLHILEETKLHFDKYFRQSSIFIALAHLNSTEKMHRLHMGAINFVVLKSLFTCTNSQIVSNEKIQIVDTDSFLSIICMYVYSRIPLQLLADMHNGFKYFLPFFTLYIMYT